ncbi:hypothetical protein I3843_13G080400 [Carya illinoinensis]|nr:hypothetical protein I3843_13G080400 [Carya illinoinensis]KAG7949788.1 hypothetical protein I3843_13G080400 [Carya illinoinensis]
MSTWCQDPSPNPKSPKRDPTRPGKSLAAELLSDPLLRPGSYIDATVTGRDGTASMPGIRRSSDSSSPSLASKTSNGVDTPFPESTESPAGAQQRRGAAAALPDWLPPGWSIEDRVRISGASAGTIDRYFLDPVSGHRFRSKKEVFFFLETGTKRKRAKVTENSDADTLGSEGQKPKKSGTKSKSSASKFDFFNVPEKVEWVLTDTSQGSWAPFIGDEKVSESTMQEWSTAFTAVASRDNDQRKS